ncbi:MAG: SHOCT domain-containing protein [Alphaproteobacteria bacterium]|nr:SHOCT domain-containing protein [Alphaproteobacteria bacterium]
MYAIYWIASIYGVYFLAKSSKSNKNISKTIQDTINNETYDKTDDLYLTEEETLKRNIRKQKVIKKEHLTNKTVYNDEYIKQALDKLYELQEKGIISLAEFNAKKEELLNL